MVEGRLKAISMGVDQSGELTLKAGEHIIEGKGVRCQVNPSGVSSKDGKSLTRPETVPTGPGGNIGVVLLRVLVKALDVQFPGGVGSLGVDVLFEDRSPFGTGDTGVNSFVSTSIVEGRQVQIGSEIDVSSEFLVGLVVLLIKGTSLEVDDTGEPVHVIDGSSGGDLGSETVTSDGSHGNLVLVHESNDIVGDLIHVVGVVMVRASLVTVVEQPHVSHFSDFVVLSIEEGFEVLCRLDQLGKPDHSRQISLLSGEVFTSELNSVGVSHSSSLGEVADVHGSERKPGLAKLSLVLHSCEHC